MQPDLPGRITVPLYHVRFPKKLPARVALSPTVVLARLHSIEERERVAQYRKMLDGRQDVELPTHRLEIFTDRKWSWDDGYDDSWMHEKVTCVMNVLLLASGTVPYWFTEPLDEWSSDRGEWVRVGYNWRSGGAVPPGSGAPISASEVGVAGPGELGVYRDSWEISEDAVCEWARLLVDYEGVWRGKVMGLAATYLREAYIDTLTDPWRGFLAASIALESSLGGDRTELSHRVAQRMSWLLTCPEGGRAETYRDVKKRYALRSALVHAGTRPTLSETTRFLELLRAALPRLAMLIQHYGSHSAALDALDNAAVGDTVVLTVLVQT